MVLSNRREGIGKKTYGRCMAPSFITLTFHLFCKPNCTSVVVAVVAVVDSSFFLPLHSLTHSLIQLQPRHVVAWLQWCSARTSARCVAPRRTPLTTSLRRNCSSTSAATSCKCHSLTHSLTHYLHYTIP